MNKLKYFHVYNNNDGYGSLRGNYTSLDVAVEQLPKSTVFQSQIRWDHEHNLKELLPEFDNHGLPWSNDKSDIKDLKLTVDNNKILYTAQLKVSVSNNEITPEIKEEGKPYQAQSTKKVDKKDVYVSVSGHLYCEEVTINLDGIPAHRGTVLDENGKEHDQEESSVSWFER